MPKYEIHRKMDELGREYASLVKAGHGLKPHTRTKRQIEIANRIIKQYMPMITGLATRFCYGQKTKAKTKSGERIFSARFSDLTVEDLVGEATLEIISNFHYFKPPFFIHGFVKRHAIYAMSNYSAKQLGLVAKLPITMSSKVRRIVGLAESPEDACEQIMERYNLNTLQAARIYSTVKRDHLNLNETAPLEMLSEDFPEENLEGMIADENTIDPFEATEEADIADKLDWAISKLKPMQQLAIRVRFYSKEGEDETYEEVDKIIGFTSEIHKRASERDTPVIQTARTLIKNALKRLRHPSMAKYLIEPQEDEIERAHLYFLSTGDFFQTSPH